ncbi:MAG: hypothetical protein LBB85_10960 [Dysgonamonadaceae bacterium]|jgi:hypothetical protein|nr:hypothetical protein [Dysgonamonadaceae bacterium]
MCQKPGIGVIVGRIPKQSGDLQLFRMVFRFVPRSRNDEKTTFETRSNGQERSGRESYSHQGKRTKNITFAS